MSSDIRIGSEPESAAESESDPTNERTDELTEKSDPAGYQETAVDAGARIEDLTHDGGQMVPHYQDSTITLHHGNCLNVLAQLEDASVDAVVCDPPYGLANTDPQHVADTIVRWVNGDRDYIPTGAGFMGKAWDAFVPPVAVWDECLRVLKPGGHALVFAGSRTVDLMTLGLRLAGFDIRDSIAWLYGSGFPKSLDVSKAIDKAAGAKRDLVRVDASEVRNPKATGGGRDGTEGATRPWIEAAMTRGYHEKQGDTPATDAARTWQGWGTALKPAFEPVVVARKPLVGTVAANVLAHGTGALNIDATRIGRPDGDRTDYGLGNGAEAGIGYHGLDGRTPYDGSAGRWPANVVLDDTQATALDEQSGELTTGGGRRNGAKEAGIYGAFAAGEDERTFEANSGGASRFFYVAKAGADERVRVDGVAHPTVKPLALMRWLVRLVTPPGGTVLEPFAGSGTTVEAALLEGFHCIAIERETDYLPLITQRIHRRRDPIEAIKGAGEDGGLFDLLNDEGPAA